MGMGVIKGVEFELDIRIGDSLLEGAERITGLKHV